MALVVRLQEQLGKTHSIEKVYEWKLSHVSPDTFWLYLCITLNARRTLRSRISFRKWRLVVISCAVNLFGGVLFSANGELSELAEDHAAGEKKRHGAHK